MCKKCRIFTHLLHTCVKQFYAHFTDVRKTCQKNILRMVGIFAHVLRVPILRTCGKSVENMQSIYASFTHMRKLFSACA